MANQEEEAKDESRVLGSSLSWSRFPVSTLLLEIFDGTEHFGMWQGEVLDSLFQHGLDIAIEEEKPKEVEEKDWSIINLLACRTIRSCLSTEQKYAVKKRNFCTQTVEGIGGQVSKEEWSEQAPNEEKIVPI